MGPEESSRLFEQARQGSREAINAIFERYGGRLHALIRLRLGPQLRCRLESRDILQATLLKAFKGLDRFDGSGSRSLMAWMGTIARDEICDQADFHGRQKRNAARDTTLNERVDPVARQVRTEASRLQLQEDSERLEKALDALGEAQREVILLRHFEELSFPEIGELLGKSPDACRMQLARAMTALTLKLRAMP
ncbi:MAG: sigma-70 family RNA polymerase sigma factor [bacterium]|nr:sigma-70 family RNA polymerase sigma factor [bacterium]